MTNLTPTSSFDDVVQLERTTRALGGDGGPMNQQAQSLLNRTQRIADAIGSTDGFSQNGTGASIRPFISKGRDIVSFEDFGAIGDGSSHPLSDFFPTLLAAQDIYPDATSLTDEIDLVAIVYAIRRTAATKLYSPGGKNYNMGTVPIDKAQVLVSRDVVMDFAGSTITCSGSTGTSFSMSMFSFVDCRANIGNFIFNDTTFSFTAPGGGRGVQPVQIIADSKNTAGHNIGPMTVLNGQSLLTVASNHPLTARSSDIRLVGACYGVNVYYGVNLADNGDNFVGSYKLDTVNRAAFVYGVKGVDIYFSLESGQASSAQVLVSNNGSSGFQPTEDVSIKGVVGTINGGIVVSDQPGAAGTGIYRRIKLDIAYNAIGTNLVATQPIARFGAYDGSGNYLSTLTTLVMDDIELIIRPGPSVPVMNSPIQVMTPSGGYGLFKLPVGVSFQKYLFYPKVSGVPYGPVLSYGGCYSISIFGDLTAPTSAIVMPSRYLSPQPRIQEVCCELTVAARNTVGSPNQYAMGKYFVMGSLDSSGLFTLSKLSTILFDFVGSITPAFTIAAASGGSGLSVSCSGFSSSTLAQLTASVRWV